MVRRIHPQVPDRGHIITVDFTPQTGSEQAGRRPAVVLSPVAYNQKSGLCLCCPITSKVKAYPFEITLPQTAQASGVILADQVRSLDWSVRGARIVGRVESRVVEQIFERLEPLLH